MRVAVGVAAMSAYGSGGDHRSLPDPLSAALTDQCSQVSAASVQWVQRPGPSGRLGVSTFLQAFPFLGAKVRILLWQEKMLGRTPQCGGDWEASRSLKRALHPDKHKLE